MTVLKTSSGYKPFDGRTRVFGDKIINVMMVILLLLGIIGLLLHCMLFYILPLYVTNVSLWVGLKCYRFTTNGSSAEVTKPTYPLSNLIHRIGLITDLDKGANDLLYSAHFKRGQFRYDYDNENVTVEWDRENGTETFKSKMAMHGQGRLVALVAYDDRLLTVDGHTGLVYAIEDGKLEPWLMLFDGDEHIKFGMENQWAAVKGSKLYVGSHREVWEIDDQGPVWVKVVDTDGGVRHLNWTENFTKVRVAFGANFPGYMVHETCVWSDVHGRWFILPRKVFVDRTDGPRAANVLLSATPDFTDIQVVRVGEINPEYVDVYNYYNAYSHGFSSFKFVPGTDDTVIVAIKKLELGSVGQTIITAFTVEGKIIYPETPVADMDFEAFEFI